MLFLGQLYSVVDYFYLLSDLIWVVKSILGTILVALDSEN